MLEGSIKLIGVIGVSSAAIVRDFVTHYRLFGVQEFLLSLHVDPGQEAARDAVLKVLRDAGIRPRHVWTGTFTHAFKDQQLTWLRDTFTGPDDWIVYADTDEHHEFLVPLPTLRRACERHGRTYVMGRWIDRLADGGDLPRVNPALDLYAQFPWATHLSNTLGRKSYDATTKLCFVSARVFPSNAGFHRPRDRDWRTDPERWPGLIACHHFKWDWTLRQRFEARARDWIDVPVSQREAEAVEEHLRVHGGRIDLADLTPRRRQCDASPVIRRLLRFCRFAWFALRSTLGRGPVPAQGGADGAITTWCGIYR